MKMTKRMALGLSALMCSGTSERVMYSTEPPSDWIALIAKSQLLYSAIPPVPFSAPNIGNGFVAFQLGPTCSGPQKAGGKGTCGFSSTGLGDGQTFLGGMHMAGVFNGIAAETVSHRARLPAVQNVQVSASSAANSTVNLVGAAVDMERAVFLNRSVVVSPACEVQVEQRIYAHQTYRNLVVHELLLNHSVTESELSCVISLNHLDATWDSPDFNYL